MNKQGGKAAQSVPSNLQMDKVSPATLLLEKRRQKYEVQKAFETEKAAFKAEEVKNKQREWDLREKDILIQENLLRFADTLQLQESMKTKDEQLALQEEQKIVEKQKEIKLAEKKRSMLLKKQALIEKKLLKMEGFREFISKVQTEFKDDFSENNAALIRYNQQNGTNLELKKQTETTAKEIERRRDQMAQYINDKKTQMLQLNNEINDMQTEHKRIEKERNKLKVEGEENAFKKTMETTQQGQIIMTINNMYKDIWYQANDALNFSAMGKNEGKEDTNPVEKKEFDNSISTEKNAIYQLEYIQLKLDALQKLSIAIQERVSKPLKAKYGGEGNEKSDEIEKIRKFLI